MLGKNAASAELEVEAAFKELESFVLAFDPIALLSQLTLTFLFFPEDEFQSEMSDVFVWQRYIEFVAGLLLIRSYPREKVATVDGTALKRLEELLERYYSVVSKRLVVEVEASKHPGNPEKDVLLAELKIESLYVRGDAYPHQFHSFAQDLYGPHDRWFRDHYGFTIAEAIRLVKAILGGCEERFNAARLGVRGEARAQAEELIAAGDATEDRRQELEAQIACALFFARSEKLLGFTIDDLAGRSGVAMQTCDRFVARMAQQFGYHNREFPDTFTDPETAPWDYNTLNERPIVTRGDGRYWVFVPPLLHSAVFNTFYFDLMSDDSYRPVFEKARGDYVEKKTAESLRRVFPPETTVLNPMGSKGEELADVMVLHDHKILLFQCKSKTLTYHARIGANFDAVRRDMKKAIADAFGQAVKARDYLKKNETAVFSSNGVRFAIDMNQVNEIQLVTVTGMPFQTLATRLANHNAVLRLFPDMEYPWSPCLGDLDIVTQVLSTPAQFIHYLQQRRKVEATPFHLNADEMDCLGFYLSHGMDFTSDEFEGMHSVGLSGFSDDIDRWVYEKFELGRNLDPPRPAMAEGFCDFLKDTEATTDEYRTDCAIALLRLGSVGRKQFIERVTDAKQLTVKDRGLHSVSLVLRDGKRGLSFLSFDANGEGDSLFMQVAGFAMLKKYEVKCEQWVSFGWDIGSNKAVDVAFFASYPWSHDAGVERLVKDSLRPGRQIDT
jgi:hypothetical protein